MKKLIIRYGLYAGCVLVVLGLFNWWVFGQAFGYHASELFGYGSMIVSLLTIPAGILYFKKKLNDGQVSFAEGLKVGVGIALVASFIMFIYGALFFLISTDEFMLWYEKSVGMEEWNKIQNQMEAMPEYVFSPLFQGFILFVTVFLIGLIIALISSLVLKTSWSAKEG